MLVELYREVGPFVGRDIQEHITDKGVGPSPHTFIKHFGGMGAARAAARKVLGIEADEWLCQWCRIPFGSLMARCAHERVCLERPGNDNTDHD